MAENRFQSSLIRELRERFPGCIVQKNDAGYVQGIPDLTIFYGEKWATLECKRSANAPHRPNQDFYVGRMREMSFSEFIYPENREDVLDELGRFFER